MAKINGVTIKKEKTFRSHDCAERAVQAQRHTEDMENMYLQFIRDSLKNTKIYGEKALIPHVPSVESNMDPMIQVVDKDSVKAIFDYAEGKTAVLNFASYKEPGGKFIQGSCAQEECLCHASYLYNVLKRFPEYYNWNNQHKNKALYLNRALYTKSVIFQNEEHSRTYCDVITCAAPNKTAAKKYMNISDAENSRSLRSRIQFVLKVAASESVETLLLGAFGCGVFGQNPMEVANIFKEELAEMPFFKKVIFAILPGENFEKFQEVFPQMSQDERVEAIKDIAYE